MKTPQPNKHDSCSEVFIAGSSLLREQWSSVKSMEVPSSPNRRVGLMFGIAGGINPEGLEVLILQVALENQGIVVVTGLSAVMAL